MPSQTHAVLVDLFRSAPSLALDLLSTSGIAVPGAPPRVLDSTFPVTSPDYHVDLALVCEDAVAEWARRPVTLGARGSVFHAIVLGPAAMPRAATPAAMELAVLSALAHGAAQPDTLRLAIEAIDAAGPQRGAAYLDLLRYHLGAALERALEELMATSERPYLSDWANGHYDRGVAAGKTAEARAALLTVLIARGITPSDADRARIDACTDVATLHAWIERAVRAMKSTDVFAG
jgi:hypothetical protein